MNGRAEVGLPAVLLGVTALLAVLAPLLLPARLVVIDPLEGPTVSAPTPAVSAVALALAACAVLLARRWARLTRSHGPAALAIGSAHALAWAGLFLLAWPLASGDDTWFSSHLVGLWGYVFGYVSGLAATWHRLKVVPEAVRQPTDPGEAVAFSGHGRLSADVAAPLLVCLLLIGVPSLAQLPHVPSGLRLPILLVWLLILLLYGNQLRALWVTVTIGVNGIRIRTGPFGHVLHRDWDQIGAVEALDAELPNNTVLWVRRFARSYVLRPGPALRIRPTQPHLPAVTVSVDHADRAAAIAARHLADHTQHHG